MEDFKKQFALNLIAYAVQRNVSAVDLCNAASVDLKRLRAKEGSFNSTQQLNNLWVHAIRLTNDPLLGLHFGESLKLAALGVVGQIIQTSKTVGEALNLAAQSISLITDSVSMDVSHKRKISTIRFKPTTTVKGDLPILQQLIDFFMVFTIHEMDGLVLEKVAPLSVSLPIRNVAYLKEYERVFRCKPRKANECFMEFDSHYANVEIITANHELQGYLLSLTSKAKPVTEHSLISERVVNYLTANAYLGIATLEDIASNFNMSARTLQRKLNEEGMSYQQIADAIRKSIALHYLESGKYPIKEISHILGYNEVSAFTRAFKRWTGKTPMGYR